MSGPSPQPSPLVPTSASASASALTGAAYPSPGRLLVLLAIGLVLAALVLLHAPGLNGPWYWKWRWQRADAWRVYPCFALAAVPFLWAQYLHTRRQSSARSGGHGLSLGLLMLSFLLLQVAGAAHQGDPIRRIAAIAAHPGATSYHANAVTVLQRHPEWGAGAVLGNYTDILSNLTRGHGRNKPPGPLFYYWLLARTFGPERSALVGGLLVAVLATGSIAATYWFVRSLTADPHAAFAAASFAALCPGLVLFCPQFDQVYPLLTCLLLGLWLRGLHRDRALFTVGTGVVLAGMSFVTYNVLVLGAAMGATGVLAAFHPHRPKGGGGWRLLLRHSLLALLVAAALYGILWILTGFDPFSTFRVALTNQQRLLESVPRPYPWTILFDLTDFALGAGWISVVLVGYWVIGRPRRPVAVGSPAGDPPAHSLAGSPMSVARLAWLFLAQIALVAVVGLLPGETARVWLFLLPLLMLPVGLELARWRATTRLAVYGLLLLLTAVIAQNMTLIRLRPRPASPAPDAAVTPHSK